MTDTTPLHIPTATVTLAGEAFTVRPFTFGQLPFVTKKLASIAGSLGPEQFANIPLLIAEGGEDILEVLALAIKKPRSYFDTLDDHAGGIELLAAVIAVNKELFAKNLQPALLKLTAAVTGKAA